MVPHVEPQGVAHGLVEALSLQLRIGCGDQTLGADRQPLGDALEDAEHDRSRHLVVRCQSTTQRKPVLPVELSGVFAVRAATR